jgi:hypothetical protein
LKRPPGGMFPESHCRPSAADVCATLSSFSQLIVVPAAIVSGFAPNAVVVWVDVPVEIVIVVLPAGGVGVVDGTEGALFPLHAAAPRQMQRMTVTRRDMVFEPSCEIGQPWISPACAASISDVIGRAARIFRGSVRGGLTAFPEAAYVP